MQNRILLATAATLLLAAFAFTPRPAAAAWLGGPASAAQASHAELSGAIEVRSRGRRHSRRHHRNWWGIPFVAAPFYQPSYQYYYFGPHKRRCGYVWNPRIYRHVWSCW